MAHRREPREFSEPANDSANRELREFRGAAIFPEGDREKREDGSSQINFREYSGEPDLI